MKENKIPYPEYGTIDSATDAIELSKKIGFPLLVRPSYVLGGQSMKIVINDKELEEHVVDLIKDKPDGKILLDHFLSGAIEAEADATLLQLRKAYNTTLQELSADSLRLLQGWPAQVESVRSEQYSYTVRNREIKGDNYTTSLSELQIPKVVECSQSR